jgi:small GTP-binding protein
MGALVSSLAGPYLAETSMIGLDGAGKTTILYQLHRNKVLDTISTIGANVETIYVKNVQFDIYDFGGGEKIRFMWSKYSARCQCIIFVIDSRDRARLGEAKEMLRSAATFDDMRDCPLLVFVNKQDTIQEGSIQEHERRTSAISLAEITDQLALHTVRDRSTYAIYPCSAVTGEGLRVGLDWLAETFVRIGQKRSKPYEGGAW